MASMIAKASSNSSQMSPAVTVQENGSKNKRKFMADPSLGDSDKMIASSQNECTSFEFSAEKFDIIPSRGNLSGCDMCIVNQVYSDAIKRYLGLSCAVGSSEVVPSHPREDTEAIEEIHDSYWGDLTESQLEELVLSNLDTIFKSAIKKIVTFGYCEEVAMKIVLKFGIYRGCKDTVSNVVDNALAFLTSGQEVDPSKELHFEDLQQMETYVLAELVCILREVRPYFSTGDAMWCLLICDMNVSLACAVDSDPLISLVGDKAPNRSSSISAHPELMAEATSFEFNILNACKPNLSVARAHGCPSLTPTMALHSRTHGSRSEASTMEGVSDFKIKSPLICNGLASEKDCPHFKCDSVDGSFGLSGTSQSSVREMKFGTNRKIYGITSREYIPKQKETHLEKHYRAYGSKRATRLGKHGSFGGLILDKKLKSVSKSTGVTVKNASLKIRKELGDDVSEDEANHHLSTNIGLPCPSAFGLETVNTNIPSILPTISTPLMLSAADTELSLSLPSANFFATMPTSCNTEASNSSHAWISYCNSVGQWVPQDKRDEMILKLAPMVQELQNQLQEWTEWANQKVMQAARRLSKDKIELKALRQEKEEVERSEKEKEILEENTMKKLFEMENALYKASGQVEQANAAVRRLEGENAALRQAMESVKLDVVESAVRCKEVLKREKKTLGKSWEWGKQKSLFQEELGNEKCKLAELLQELDGATILLDQLKARGKQEEISKEDVLTQVSLLKIEREQIEASTKSKDDNIKVKAENNLQKIKDDIKKLEKEIYQLRLRTDSSKIAALKRGIDGSYDSRLTEFKNYLAPVKSQIPYISKIVTDFEDYSCTKGLKRERECIMCLSDEMSVVFLPCAHQIVCTTCNELHKKQGLKDCPSCRSPIQQRICVCYARP